MGVKFGTGEGTFGHLLHAKFHPHGCNVSPLRGGKPQNRHLSNLNNRRLTRGSAVTGKGARDTCTSDIMSVLQMHGSMKNLERRLAAAYPQSPHLHKKLIFTTQNPPLKYCRCILTCYIARVGLGRRVRVGVRNTVRASSVIYSYRSESQPLRLTDGDMP